ncbi:hypothetical protein OBV_22060 [Oscillibacter valericigenes Sjm18-20]|nr:hypothetical protein OBV_22060 [Oscillibacter valericigenes Sjm18-20]
MKIFQISVQHSGKYAGKCTSKAKAANFVVLPWVLPRQGSVIIPRFSPDFKRNWGEIYHNMPKISISQSNLPRVCSFPPILGPRNGRSLIEIRKKRTPDWAFF